MFQGIGTRGLTGGWTGSGLAKGFGVDAEGYEGGEK